ncbi:hypothetical protein [Abyssogena phaseoliformis symbiont]|nr:hypothetical protein [Abyssogena phaseoliformis symbiont]MBW5289468.1 hypothetical protein [Candidatus Ruthia sp. Apha_13_S6]
MIDPKTLDIEVTDVSKALISDEKNAFIEGVSAKLAQGKMQQNKTARCIG